MKKRKTKKSATGASSKKIKKSLIKKFGSITRIGSDALATPFKVYGFQGTSTVATDTCTTQLGCGLTPTGGSGSCNAHTWTSYYC